MYKMHDCQYLHPFRNMLFAINLYFSESEAQATLQNMSFECNAASRMLAIVGPVGAGKVSLSSNVNKIACLMCHMLLVCMPKHCMTPVKCHEHAIENG